MKDQKEDIILNSNIKDSIQYQVENNAHMANILSSHIYSNPIAAVIRELSTNAYDAHLDAGIEKPFDV